MRSVSRAFNSPSCSFSSELTLLSSWLAAADSAASRCSSAVWKRLYASRPLLRPTSTSHFKRDLHSNVRTSQQLAVGQHTPVAVTHCEDLHVAGQLAENVEVRELDRAEGGREPFVELL